MANIKKKTYDDSFIFSVGKADHHNHIRNFIVSSERIENKRADNFRGVIEDVKRYQKSSVIYHVLLRDDVILCINDVEMPPTFKVFLAKDSKSNNDKRLFIDVTGIIDYKNGSYYCKNVQRLNTYLFQAITWLLYEYETEAFMNNSNITLAATDCFVKMFDYVLGYFRFYGFAENRTKIDYLAALYFMINILGKDDDQYTNQVAAKLTKVDQSLTKSYSLYYDREDLANIDSFISLLAETFKLKGLNTEVFVSRWIANCGNSTYFAVELFPPFCNMMIAAYVGNNIVKQQVIDKQCGSSMIKLCDEILRLGAAQLYKGRGVLEADEEFESIVVRSATVQNLQEANKAKKEACPQFTKETCKSVSETNQILACIYAHYMNSNQLDKFSDKAIQCGKIALSAMSITKAVESGYKKGVLPTISDAINSTASKCKSKDNIRKYKELLDSNIEKARNAIPQYRVNDKGTAAMISSCLEDLIKAKNRLK